MSQLNAYYLFFQRLARDYRLTINGLAEEFGLGNGFAPAIYRMKDVPDRVPHPRTLAKVEEKMGIKIDDSDINHIKYKRFDATENLRDFMHQTGATDISKVPVTYVPLLDSDLIMKRLNQLIKEGEVLSQQIIASVTEKRFPYFGKCSSKCFAARVQTDRNHPFIAANDIVVCDIESEISSGDYVGVYLKDDRWFIGQITKGENEYILTFYNRNHNPVVFDPKNLLSAVKIVGITRELV